MPLAVTTSQSGHSQNMRTTIDMSRGRTPFFVRLGVRKISQPHELTARTTIAAHPDREASVQLNLVVILPTYNERANIQALIPQLQEHLCAVPYHAQILVVDDNSPDRTGEAVRALQEIYPNLHLISGPKQGLGAAYIRGMQHALSALSADVVVEMDADFSHDPADLPRLLKALDLPADFVIGSRYVPGGSIPSNWGWQRKANSRVGNIVARYVAGLYRVHDCTAGFRAIRAAVLRQINFSELRVKGYAFQVALLSRAIGLSARVAEIPVHFTDRKLGISKLGVRDVIEFIINAWWIRLWSARTFIKFCIVGATGVVINLAAFSALLALPANPYLASPLAVEISILWNFLLNNAWTFRYRPKAEHVGIRGLKFNVISLAALAVTFATFVALSKSLPQLPLMVDQLLAILPATAINYFLNSYWTFRAAVTTHESPAVAKTAIPSSGNLNRPTLS
jgi:dolichol-phosphate mannosyltransferase